MLRCARAAATLWLAAGVIAPALAQQPRNFPDTARRGELVVQQAPEVLLNGKPARLAPGSRIRDTNNLLALPGALFGQKLVVNYTLDPYGLLMDVWILTPTEQARRP